MAYEETPDRDSPGGAIPGDGPRGLDRRTFLQNLGATGGTAMLLAAMDAWGIGIASARDNPPALDQSAAGTKVIIIGAGLAGMAAAFELGKFGYDCQIVEARPFAGGRCQTARAELGGTVQRCEFDDGVNFNHGPWRIPYHHRSTLHYCKEFRIPLEIMVNDNDAAYVMHENIKGPLAGKHMRIAEIKADIRGYTSEILAKTVDGDRLDDLLNADDKEQLIAHLVSTGRLGRRDLRYRGTSRRGYDDWPGAGLEPGRRSDPHDFRAVLHSGLGGQFAAMPPIDQPATMFQPVGGMDQIAKAFEKRLEGRIDYELEVERISQNENGVAVGVRNTRTDERSEVHGDFCICTIPLSVLKQIDADFSSEFSLAMDGAAYRPTGKIGLQMKRRFWEEDDFIYGGHTSTDFIGEISYPSEGWLQQKGVIQGYYNFNLMAIRVSALSPADRIEFALKHGEKVHPQYRDEFENAFSVAWHKVKYSLGGWATWSRRGREGAYLVLNEPDGRIYLAGEHLSYLTGWMAGAFESAWAQLAALHRRAVSG